jgi:hypothetical protein
MNNPVDEKKNALIKYFVGIIIVVGAILLAAASLNAQVATLQSAGATTICSGESTALEVKISTLAGSYKEVCSDGTKVKTD